MDSEKLGRILKERIHELQTALETVQASYEQCRANGRREHGFVIEVTSQLNDAIAERDAVQAENIRLHEAAERRAAAIDEINQHATETRDRLTNQITEAVHLLRCWIADYDNEMWPYPVAETRALLARCSPNEETAEEKK